MELTPQQARDMAQLIGLDIPEADLEGVALRLSSLLTAMEAIERELGAVMDKTEPVPPVYPQEPAA
jgi:uncharacterized protein HemX